MKSNRRLLAQARAKYQFEKSRIEWKVYGFAIVLFLIAYYLLGAESVGGPLMMLCGADVGGGAGAAIGHGVGYENGKNIGELETNSAWERIFEEECEGGKP